MNSQLTLADPWLAIAGLAVVLAAAACAFIFNNPAMRARLGFSRTADAAATLTDAGDSEAPLKVLRIIALLFLALALARPQKVRITELEPIMGVDIALAIDTSASMQAIDFNPMNRLDAAKNIAADFVRKRKGDRIGLIVFGGAAVLCCPPTLDHEALLAFLQQIQIGMTKIDGTAIGSGAMAALTHLRRVPSKSKVIILLTDGRNNAGSVDPAAAAQMARNMGVKIYTVGTGKRGGGIFPVQDPIFGRRYVKAEGEEIDESTLTKMASTTGGRYYRATDLQELEAIFAEIDRLEKTKVEPPRQVDYQEFYLPLAITGLMLLGLEILLRSTALLTLP
ncbi:MAG: VWA domain-containing protein [Elusimicrobiota bacterium]